MSLKNVRERTANIARVGRLLAAVPSDASESVKTVVLDALSYLLSQLKVNFRPLYSETITAIASLGSTLGEEVWGLVWEDLQKTTQSREASVVDLEWQEPGWAKRRPRTTDSEGEADEDIEFRCLSLQKGRNTFHAAWERTSETEFVDAADIEVSPCRNSYGFALTKRHKPPATGLTFSTMRLNSSLLWLQCRLSQRSTRVLSSHSCLASPNGV